MPTSSPEFVAMRHTEPRTYKKPALAAACAAAAIAVALASGGAQA
ncbi:hypothetical protein ACFW5S_32885 [Streptomyces olivaceus]